ncbi:MAG TPA: glycerol-3-phosphate acyltransferase [Pseudogracilibacillus sp.]|nr:glycerol-3-phosphate acyltransferase [Pseudogracilibacillus sp.]
MNLLLMIIIIGYAFGCLHGSQIIGKLKQINIKDGGTKNAGASNATLQLGWRYGLIVAIIDIGKAILSLQMTLYLLHYYEIFYDLTIVYLLINGLFVIIGHNYPLTMNFQGGKGTASFLGVLLFLNWKLALISFIMALIISYFSNYFVLGTLSGYLIFDGYIAYFYGKGPAMIALLFTSLFLITHTENFRRIMKDEEVKLRTFFRREAS